MWENDENLIIMYRLFLDSYMEEMTSMKDMPSSSEGNTKLSERDTKLSESNAESENAGIVDNPKIFGTWKGEFCGDRFILNFSEDGEMSEMTDGAARKFGYRLKNNLLTVSPSISDLNCVLGEELTVSFVDNELMTIRGDLWKMEMVRVEELGIHLKS